MGNFGFPTPFSVETEEERRKRQVRLFERGAEKVIQQAVQGPADEVSKFMQGAQGVINNLQAEKQKEGDNFAELAQQTVRNDPGLIKYAEDDTLAMITDDAPGARQSYVGNIITLMDNLRRVKASTTGAESLRAKQAANRNIYGADRPVDPLVQEVTRLQNEGQLRVGPNIEIGGLIDSIDFLHQQLTSPPNLGEKFKPSFVKKLAKKVVKPVVAAFTGDRFLDSLGIDTSNLPVGVREAVDFFANPIPISTTQKVTSTVVRAITRNPKAALHAAEIFSSGEVLLGSLGVDTSKLPIGVRQAVDVAAAPMTWVTAGAGPTISAALKSGRLGAPIIAQLVAPLVKGGFAARMAAETAAGTTAIIATQKVSEALPENTPWWMRLPTAFLVGGIAASGGVGIYRSLESSSRHLPYMKVMLGRTSPQIADGFVEQVSKQPFIGPIRPVMGGGDIPGGGPRPISEVLNKYRASPRTVSLKELQSESSQLGKLIDPSSDLGLADDLQVGRVTKARLANRIEAQLDAIHYERSGSTLRSTTPTPAAAGGAGGAGGPPFDHRPVGAPREPNWQNNPPTGEHLPPEFGQEDTDLWITDWNSPDSDPTSLRSFAEGVSDLPGVTGAVGKRITTWVGGAAALARKNKGMRNVATRAWFIEQRAGLVDYDTAKLTVSANKAFETIDDVYLRVTDTNGASVNKTIEEAYLSLRKEALEQIVADDTIRTTTPDVWSNAKEKLDRIGTGINLTPSQRQFLLDYKELVDAHSRRFELATGLTLEEAHLIAKGDVDYLPRIVKDSKGKAHIPTVVGAKQPFQKPRLFEYMEQGIAEGVPYAGPMDAFRLFGYSINRAIADTFFLQYLKSMPEVSVLSKTLNEQRKMLIRVVADEAVKANDNLRWQKAVDRLDFIGRRITPEGKPRSMVSGAKISPALAGDYFDEKLFDDIRSVMGPGNVYLKKLDMVNAAARFVVTGAMDLGQFFLQGLVLLGSAPHDWAVAVYRSLEALTMPKAYERWFIKNAQTASRHMRLGSGTEFTFAPTSLLKPPGLRAIPRAFEAFVDAGRIVKFNGLVEAGKIVPDTLEAYRMGRLIDQMLGVPNIAALGQSALQRQAEAALLLYSPRYTRSIFGMMSYLFTNGATQREAAKALSMMTAGGMLFYIGLARGAFGMSPEEIIERINPFSKTVLSSPSKYMSFPIGGMEFGIGGQYRANMAMIGQIFQQDNWTDLNTWSEKALRNPIAMRLRAISAPTTSLGIDYLIDHQDFLGRTMSIDDLVTNPSLIKEQVQARMAPQVIQGILEANPDAGAKIGAGIASALGGRTRPASPWDVRDAVAYEITSGKIKHARDLDLPDLQQAQETPEWIEAEKDIAKFRTRTGDRYQIARDAIDAARADIKDKQRKLDSEFVRGDKNSSDEWRREHKLLQVEMSARQDEIYKSIGLTFEDRKNAPKVRAALDAYFDLSPDDKRFIDPETNDTNWRLFNATREKALVKLNPRERQSVEKELIKHMTPTEIKFRQASKLLNKAPARYNLGLGPEKDKIVQEEYVKFAKDVDALTRTFNSENAVKGYPGPTVQENDVADQLAARRNTPELALIFKALKTDRGKDAILNKDFDTYLITHRAEIEPFFPTLYPGALFKRTGLLTEPRQVEATGSFQEGRSGLGLGPMGRGIGGN